MHASTVRTYVCIRIRVNSRLMYYVRSPRAGFNLCARLQLLIGRVVCVHAAAAAVYTACSALSPIVMCSEFLAQCVARAARAPYSGVYRSTSN